MNLASNFFGQAAELMDSHIQRQNLIRARPDPMALESKPQVEEKKSKKKSSDKKEEKEKKPAKITGYRVFSNERIKELKEQPQYASNLHTASGVKELNPIVNADWKNLPSDRVEMYKRIAEQMQDQIDKKTSSVEIVPKHEKPDSKAQLKEKIPEPKVLNESLSKKLQELLSKSEKKQKRAKIKVELSDTSSTPSLSEDERPHKKLKRF
jgi:hypothetical protein